MRIFIADKSNEVRLSLQIFLSQVPRMNVIGMAVKAAGLVEQIAASQPDVLLINWELADSVSPNILSQIHAMTQRPKVIIMGVSPMISKTALVTGADAFLFANSPPDELPSILRTIEARTRT